MDETPRVLSQPLVVHPPCEIDYATAPALGRQIAEALAGGCGVVVDCSRVTFCDSTGLKVLINASKHAKALDADFRLTHPPRVLLRIAAVLQASELLGLPQPADRDGRGSAAGA